MDKRPSLASACVGKTNCTDLEVFSKFKADRIFDRYDPKRSNPAARLPHSLGRQTDYNKDTGRMFKTERSSNTLVFCWCYVLQPVRLSLACISIPKLRLSCGRHIKHLKAAFKSLIRLDSGRQVFLYHFGKAYLSLLVLDQTFGVGIANLFNPMYGVLIG